MEKKKSSTRRKALAEKRLEQQPTKSEFGEILMELEAETTPYQVFEKIANFDTFFTDIVILQTILYSQQKTMYSQQVWKKWELFSACWS